MKYTLNTKQFFMYKLSNEPQKMKQIQPAGFEPATKDFLAQGMNPTNNPHSSE